MVTLITRKNQRSKEGNTRNGYSPKKVRSSYGEDSIKVPRDRDGSFNPMIVPKRQNMVDGIGNVIVSLYAKGMSNSYRDSSCRWKLKQKKPQILLLFLISPYENFTLFSFADRFDRFCYLFMQPI